MRSLVYFLSLFSIFTLARTNPQAKLGFAEYCLYHDYPTQTHLIRTSDRYVLKFFRLQAKNSQIQPRNKVVYLQHGLEDSADTWIVNNEHLAPGFILANQGYDVWLGNTRGNVYSNPILNPKIKEFWNFTFDQMAKYDLTAAFDYINNVTGKKIHYIGHSQGTMIMFAALSQGNHMVKSNLASFSALGPVAYLYNQQSKVLRRLAHTGLSKMLKSLQVKQFLYTSRSQRIFTSILCAYDKVLCNKGLLAISEKNNSVNNLERLPVIMGHFPSGSSLKNIEHFEQLMKSGKFAKFDYGAKTNMVIYGNKEPPKYDLTKITFPVHLFVGQYDRLADVKDAQKLFSQLGSGQKTMTKLQFGHATFIWGKDASYVKSLIKIIESSQ